MLPLIVTAAIIRKNDTVLLTRRPEGSRHAGMWEFPGGKVDRNESPSACLRRELREELGIEADIGAIFEVVYHRYDWGPVLILAYECRYSGGTIQHLGVADHHWVALADLPDYTILEADTPIIDKLLGIG